MRRPKQIKTKEDQFISDYCDFEDLSYVMEEVVTRVARKYSEYDVRAIVNKASDDIELSKEYKNALEEIDQAVEVFSKLSENLKKRIPEKLIKKHNKSGWWN